MVLPAHFEEDLHTIRPQSGQLATARNIRKPSRRQWQYDRSYQQRVQDPYTLRCIPQIHGASKDSIAYVKPKLRLRSTLLQTTLLLLRKVMSSQAVTSTVNQWLSHLTSSVSLFLKSEMFLNVV